MTRGIVALFLMVSIVCLTNGSPPPGLLNRLDRVAQKFDGVASFGDRVELSLMRNDVHVDPSPGRSHFLDGSSIRISIESPYCYEHIHAVLLAARHSRWQPVEYGRVSRAYWRILSESGEVLLDLLICVPYSSIWFEGQWYEVDQGVVEAVTDGFLDITGKMLVASRQTVIEAVGEFEELNSNN